MIEARWRFYLAQSMGAKHKNGRALTLADFLPNKPTPVVASTAPKPWEQQLELLKELMKPKNLAGYEQLPDRGSWVKPE